MLRLTFGFVLLASSTVHAQNVVAVDLQGQPLIYTKDGKATGCGVRVVGVMEPVAGRREFRAFDLSANIWADGAALAKVIGSAHGVGTSDAVQGTRQPLYGAWFRAEADDPVAPLGSGFAPSATDKGAYLYPVRSEAVADFLLAVVRGQSILVGLRWQRELESIYSGTVRLDVGERRQIAGCVSSVFK